MAPVFPVLNPTKSLVCIPGSGYDRKAASICLSLGYNNLYVPGRNSISGYVHQTQYVQRRVLYPRMRNSSYITRTTDSTPLPFDDLPSKRKADSSLGKLPKRTRTRDSDGEVSTIEESSCTPSLVGNSSPSLEEGLNSPSSREEGLNCPSSIEEGLNPSSSYGDCPSPSSMDNVSSPPSDFNDCPCPPSSIDVPNSDDFLNPSSSFKKPQSPFSFNEEFSNAHAFCIEKIQNPSSSEDCANPSSSIEKVSSPPSFYCLSPPSIERVTSPPSFYGDSINPPSPTEKVPSPFQVPTYTEESPTSIGESLNPPSTIKENQNPPSNIEETLSTVSSIKDCSSDVSSIRNSPSPALSIQFQSSTPDTSESDSEEEYDEIAEEERSNKLDCLLHHKVMLQRINSNLKRRVQEYKELLEDPIELVIHLKSLKRKSSFQSSTANRHFEFQ